MPKHFPAPTNHRPGRKPRATAKNLILGLTLAEKVARREVTLIVLPVKGTHHFKRYITGTTLPVRGYVGGPVLADVHLVDVRRSMPATQGATGMPAPLGEPTFPEARAAGHVTVTAFKVAWVTEHDPAWMTKEPRDENAIIARYDTRHARRLAWTLTVRVRASQNPSRLLLARPSIYDPRRDPFSPSYDRTLENIDTEEDRGYTSTPARALDDAGDALTDAEYKTHISHDARDREERRKAQQRFEREHAGFPARVAAAEAATRARRVGLRDEFRRLDRLIEQGRGDDALKQLARIETRAFPEAA